MKINLIELETRLFFRKANEPSDDIKAILDLIKNLKQSDEPLDLIGGLTKNEMNSLSEDDNLFANRTLYTRLINILYFNVLKINNPNNSNISILQELIIVKKVISPIFSISFYRNPDYFLLPLLNNARSNDTNALLIDDLTRLKISAIFCLSSSVPVEFIQQLYQNRNALFVQLCTSLLSISDIYSENARKNRDWILNNISEPIDKISSMDEIKGINLDFLNPYFLCTYSTIKNRHQIKESIHELFRRINFLAKFIQNIFFMKSHFHLLIEFFQYI